MSKPPSTLYISYDGMLEPLGQSQVLAYQEKLASFRAIHLLTFEKALDWANTAERRSVQVRIAQAGLTWHPRRYHKQPTAPATAYDILVGIVTGVWLVLRHRIPIVHARSYVAGVMGLAIKKLTGVHFVFDMRGFWADERVDGGLWPAGGRMYRVAKWFEKQMLLNADYVVSLTHAGVREMQRFPYLQGRMPRFEVIPTCADLSLFRPAPAEKPQFVLGYVGSAGTWYEFDAAARCFAELRRRLPDALFLVVNRGEHAYIRERLQQAGVPAESVELLVASHAEVPQLIARMDAAVFFIKPLFSKQASAPTKLGELLGCGVPVLSNCGVGDMADILQREQVGVALLDFEPASVLRGLEELLALAAAPEVRRRCVKAAHTHFSLEEGVRRYKGVYAQLAAQ